MRFACLIGALLALAIMSPLSADEKKDPKVAFDPAKIVGTWNITSGTKNGEKASDAALKAVFKIEKEKMTLESPEGKFVFKYKVDAKASPVAIDLEMTESPFGGGAKAKGIVSLEGEEMKLCYTMEGDRPAKFDGAKAFLFALKKKKD